MSYDYAKEAIYNALEDFLIDHSISELLNIIADVIEEKENNYERLDFGKG